MKYFFLKINKIRFVVLKMSNKNLLNELKNRIFARSYTHVSHGGLGVLKIKWI